MGNDKNYDFSVDLTVVPKPYDQLTFVQRSYIDWKALNGLITEDDGNIRKMPLSELAATCGCTISAFQQAKAAIPNFWDMVVERRRQLASQTRLAKVYDAWYLKAAKGEFQHMQLYLANFDPHFRMPTEKVQHELGDGLADALNIARERQLKTQNAIEGEVVDGTPDA